MSCVLRVGGTDFAVDEFLAGSSLKPIAVFRKGQSQLPEAIPHGRKISESGMHISASEADFSDVGAQISDAIAFLERNNAALRQLVAFPGIEMMALDFGIEERDVPAQTERFPPKLLKILGDLGISLKFTLYPPE